MLRILLLSLVFVGGILNAQQISTAFVENKDIDYISSEINVLNTYVTQLNNSYNASEAPNDISVHANRTLKSLRKLESNLTITINELNGQIAMATAWEEEFNRPIRDPAPSKYLKFKENRRANNIKWAEIKLDGYEIDQLNNNLEALTSLTDELKSSKYAFYPSQPDSKNNINYINIALDLMSSTSSLISQTKVNQ